MAECFVDGKPVKSLKVVELKQWLHNRGVKTRGKKKADLVISVQECLSKPVAENTVTVPKVKKTSSLPAHAGNLIDNPDALPTFTIENVLDYLINRKEDDCMKAEDWKSFKAGGYRLFKDGHVQDIMVNQKDSLLEIKCNCLPEMKKDRIYKIQIDISSDTSDVNHAECTCPAGKGPHGSCKHVAAALFALQDFYATYEEMQISEEDVACTSKLQTWNRPRKRRLDSKCASEISFRVEDYYQKPCNHSKEFMDPRPNNVQKTTEKEIKDFIENLKGMEYACGFLSVLVPLDAPDESKVLLPLTPRSAQSKINAQIIEKCELPPSLEVITSHFEKFVDMIKPSSDQRNLVEKKTRKQGSCKRWQEERHLRLTASNFGRVILRRSNYEKLAEEILYSKLPNTIPSLEWGRMHENDAFTAYLENYFHPSGNQDKIRKAGFYIGDPSFIGASPDGIIEREGSIHKIIEIKCPFSFRNSSVEEACTKNEFYCTMEDDLLHLKRTHSYYYQIQGTMGITGAVQCDFIVWTTISMKVETISFDKTLWEDVMLPKLCEFYYNNMLPFVVY